ncbi:MULTISPECIES: hypothetical protein [Paenibacillus]|uniref:hypothetical protein n=1 Tax=Paenibacillus TaxID=44249 RepID=UPI0022B8DD7B|nr:hypothetical protein [Paenibacillus caseinilyticus]MCZ8519923.1 hypothetical protein [Paenibacillus caseinilyticus]
MDTLIYTALACAYLLLIASGLQRLRERGGLSYSSIPLLVTLGLFYDNGIIAAGEWIGEGRPLRFLSEFRYWTHALFTPSLVLFAWDTLRRAGISRAHTLWSEATAWLVTLGLAAYQTITAVLPEVASLAPLREYGILRYVPQAEGGGPLMVIAVAGLLLAAGMILAFRQRWVWMAAGTAVLFAGRLIPMPLESSALTNVFELILIIALWATARHQDRCPGRTAW